MSEENQISSYEQLNKFLDDAISGRVTRRKNHINLLKENLSGQGFNVEILEETSGGTNKETLFVKITPNEFSSVLTPEQIRKLIGKEQNFNAIGTVILTKKDNFGHGKSAEEGEGIIIATKLMGLITNGKIDKAIEFLEEYNVKNKLGDELQLQIKTDVETLRDNKTKLKKLLAHKDKDENLKVKLKTPEVLAYGIIELNGDKKAWYLGSKLAGEVTDYKENQEYEAGFAKKQAIGDSLFANLVTEILGQKGVKKLFGDKDPFRPNHMLEKADYLLDSYNRTLGVGLSLLLDKNDEDLFPKNTQKLTDGSVKSAIQKLEKKGIYIEDIYSEGESHLIQQKEEIAKLQTAYEAMLQDIPPTKFDKGDRWIDNITEKSKKNEKQNKIKSKTGVFDHEEGGLTCPLVAVALHISSLGGYDFENGKLNDVGKAIIEANRKTGYLDGTPNEGEILTDVEQKHFATAMAVATKYIEIMRITKTGEFLFTARSSLIERNKFEKVYPKVKVTLVETATAINNITQISKLY